jgi:hypothetical protein
MVVVLSSTDDHDSADVHRRGEARHDDNLGISITDKLRLSSETASERLEDAHSVTGLCHIEGSCGGIEHGVQVPVVIRVFRVVAMSSSV